MKVIFGEYLYYEAKSYGKMSFAKRKVIQNFLSLI